MGPMPRALRRLLPVLLVLALGAALAGRGGGEATGASSEATVVRVVDGDTIVARVDGRDESVR